MSAPIFYALAGTAQQMIAKMQEILERHPDMFVEGNGYIYVGSESLIAPRANYLDTGDMWEGWRPA